MSVHVTGYNTFWLYIVLAFRVRTSHCTHTHTHTLTHIRTRIHTDTHTNM